MSRRFDIVSFDLDGTLVDTAEEIAEAANRTLEEFGYARRSVDAVTLLIGAGTRELMRRLLEAARDGEAAGSASRAAAPIDEEAVQSRFAVHYAATAGTTCRLYDGCAEALAELRRSGIALACLTNKEARYTRSVLRATGIEPCFDIVVAGDTFAFKKPDPRVVDRIVAALQRDRGAMAHVGDSRTDVETARNAGIAAWAVPWGYNGGEPVERAKPDAMFASLADVARRAMGASESSGP